MNEEFIIDRDVRVFIPARLNPYRTMTGDVRPDIGWLGRPYGTFDNIPLLENPILIKGGGLNLTPQIIQVVRDINPDSNGRTAEEKFNWLISPGDTTTMVMSYDATMGIYRQLTPEVAGGALVNVLEIVGMFAKIECWPVGIKLLRDLPDYLVYTWTALTIGGTSFQPVGGVKFPILYWRPWAYIPLQWVYKV